MNHPYRELPESIKMCKTRTNKWWRHKEELPIPKKEYGIVILLFVIFGLTICATAGFTADYVRHEEKLKGLLHTQIKVEVEQNVSEYCGQYIVSEAKTIMERLESDNEKRDAMYLKAFPTKYMTIGFSK